MSASPIPVPQLPVAEASRGDVLASVPATPPLSFAATLKATAAEALSRDEQQVVPETVPPAAEQVPPELVTDCEPEGDTQSTADIVEAGEPAVQAVVAPVTPPPPPPPPLPQAPSLRMADASPVAADRVPESAGVVAAQPTRGESPEVDVRGDASSRLPRPAVESDASDTPRQATSGGKPVEGATATVEPAPVVARRSIFAALRGDDRASRSPASSIVDEPVPTPTPAQVVGRTGAEVGRDDLVEPDAPPQVATGGEPNRSARTDAPVEIQAPAPEITESTVVGAGTGTEPGEWVREVAAALVALADEVESDATSGAEVATPTISEIDVAASPGLRSQPGSAVATPDASNDMGASVPVRIVAEPQRSEGQPRFVTLPFEAPDGGGGRLRVAVIGDQVHATMLVEPHAVASLELALPELRRALDAKGYGDAQLAVRANAADGLPVATAPSRGEQAGSEHAGRETPERRTNQFDQRREDARQHRHHPDEEAE